MCKAVLSLVFYLFRKYNLPAIVVLAVIVGFVVVGAGATVGEIAVYEYNQLLYTYIILLYSGLSQSCDSTNMNRESAHTGPSDFQRGQYT